ncbi:hypothetical protein GGD46_004148 [Rhizobium lusitanum]|uniref:Uncharacterized protein n=1 Tax=Rhizobium lusitanum TaxID=293958 RepID=A0A7X0MDQ4_9HYPH|nr:hypothetical protein [Rhizobium lusitanum]
MPASDISVDHPLLERRQIKRTEVRKQIVLFGKITSITSAQDSHTAFMQRRGDASYALASNQTRGVLSGPSVGDAALLDFAGQIASENLSARVPYSPAKDWIRHHPPGEYLRDDAVTMNVAARISVGCFTDTSFRTGLHFYPKSL